MNLKKLTRPQILKMDLITLDLRVNQLLEYPLKVKKVNNTDIDPIELQVLDLINDLNDNLKVMEYLRGEGHLLMLEFPYKDDNYYILKRFMEHEGDWIWDSVKGESIQEVVLKTALLANIPKEKQRISIRRQKNKFFF